MARGNVNNPFKEKHSALPRYAAILVTFGLCFFAYTKFSETETETIHRLVRSTDAPANNVVTKTHHHKAAKEEETANDDESEEEPSFPKVSLSHFPSWLHEFYETRKWKHRENPDKLTRKVLKESLSLGCDNMVANQKEAGNFNYEYDFVTHEQNPDDMQVRQAGAVWGLALCYQATPENKEYEDALQKALDFFLDNSGHVTKEVQFCKYPDDDTASTGSNALVSLAMIEYLRAINDNDLDVDPEYKTKVEKKLKAYINFIKFMQKDNHRFSEEYNFETETKSRHSSPYFDGESMLCLVKAAKYIDGYDDLIPLIEETVLVLAKSYTVDAWRNDEHDSDETKGFYQWSSMFYAEYFDAGWKNAEVCGDYVLTLAHWIIHTHGVLDRTKNTGYAFEGIISAYHVAKKRKDLAAKREIAYAIDVGMYKLTSWQVGGPLQHENEFLMDHPTDEAIAIGGVMNHHQQAPLRIDEVQHQMHAVMLAMEHVYRK